MTAVEVLGLLGTAFIVGTGLAVTPVPFLLAWVSRGVWYTRPTGWALMASSAGLALLADLALVFRVVAVDPLVRAVVTAGVLGLVMTGAWLLLGALLVEWYRGRKNPPPL